jgi:PAS domain S-box-containing protein
MTSLYLSDLPEILEPLIESPHMAIVIVDKKGFITVMNQTFLDLLEMSREDVIGHYVTDILPTSKLPEVLKTGRIDRADIWAVRDRDTVVTRFPIMADGKIIGAIGQSLQLDVSGASLFINRLKEAEKDFSAIVAAFLENPYTALVIVNQKGYITMMNRSHTNAINATDNGVFKREIVPVEVVTKKGVNIIETDEHPIRGCSMESVGRLKPAFKKDGGVVTAANASGINDGASAAVIMSKQKAAELGIKPLMKMVASVGVGVDPQIMGIGPAEAIPVALKQAGWNFDDVEYWELHEAFAPQFIGCKIRLKENYGMDLSMDKVNHNGSGIALGHPIGSSGLRIVVSLYYELERLGLTRGGASTCVGTGPAMASLWTRDI